MLHHFAHQAIDGDWHCVYRTPGCESLSSVGAGMTEEQAIEHARRRNREQREEQRRFRDYQQQVGAR